jgi:hypothetical protein
MTSSNGNTWAWEALADATLEHDQPRAVTAEQRILELLGAVPGGEQVTS